MNAKLISLVVLFVLSLAIVGVITAKRSGPEVRGQGFTLEEIQRFYPADGSTPITVSTTTRYQKSDGSWRKDSTCNGKTTLGFSLPARGVFAVDEESKRLNFVGDPQRTVFSEEMLRKEPGFVREETILGLKTFLIHSISTETGESNEAYICPALQGYPLKRVVRYKTGSTAVFEVTHVTLGAPPESFFTSLPNYEVNYDKTR